MRERSEGPRGQRGSWRHSLATAPEHRRPRPAPAVRAQRFARPGRCDRPTGTSAVTRRHSADLDLCPATKTAFSPQWTAKRPGLEGPRPGRWCATYRSWVVCADRERRDQLIDTTQRRPLEHDADAAVAVRLVHVRGVRGHVRVRMPLGRGHHARLRQGVAGQQSPNLRQRSWIVCATRERRDPPINTLQRSGSPSAAGGTQR